MWRGTQMTKGFPQKSAALSIYGNRTEWSEGNGGRSIGYVRSALCLADAGISAQHAFPNWEAILP